MGTPLSLLRGSARIDTTTGKVTPLDGRAEADEVVTEDDVQEPAKLARLLCRILKTLAELRRRFAPRRIDFHDVTTPGSGGTISLQHNFGGRVVWWIIDYQIITTVTAPILQRSVASSTDNTLVLLTHTTGLASIRIEEAG